MGYQIQYQPELEHKYPIQKNNAYKTRIIVLSLLLLMVFSAYFIKQNTWIQGILLPDQTTQEAVAVMAEQVRAGENVVDAFAAFCIEIIGNG